VPKHTGDAFQHTRTQTPTRLACQEWQGTLSALAGSASRGRQQRLARGLREQHPPEEEGKKTKNDDGKKKEDPRTETEDEAGRPKDTPPACVRGTVLERERGGSPKKPQGAEKPKDEARRRQQNTLSFVKTDPDRSAFQHAGASGTRRAETKEEAGWSGGPDKRHQRRTP